MLFLGQVSNGPWTIYSLPCPTAPSLKLLQCKPWLDWHLSPSQGTTPFAMLLAWPPSPLPHGTPCPPAQFHLQNPITPHHQHPDPQGASSLLWICSPLYANEFLQHQSYKPTNPERPAELGSQGAAETSPRDSNRKAGPSHARPWHLLLGTLSIRQEA